MGRARELAVVDEALAAVATGQGRLLILVGEPGVGKTRLAQEITRKAHAQGFRVITGRCYEPQQTIAYYPFLEALTMAMAGASPLLQTQLPERWPEVARLLPDHLASAQMSLQLDDRSAQQRLFWQVTGFLGTLAEQAPIALLLDDLQWADSASLDLLQHLARRTRERPILLVGTAREVEARRRHPLASALSDLSRDEIVLRIALQRLAVEETSALIGATLSADEGAEMKAPSVSPQLSRLIYQRTEGNAFFTRQLTRALQERDELQFAKGQWMLTAGAAGALEAPESIRAVIGQRLGRLTSLTQDVLREASVLGQVVAFDELRQLGERGEQEVEEALEEAVGAGIVREGEHDCYHFNHVLTRDTLYSELTARRKRRLHRAAAETIEAAPDHKRRVAELAYHYARAHDHEKALLYLLKAAEDARSAASYHEEASLLGQAIEAAEQLGRSQLVNELHALRGRALRALDQAAAAEHEFLTALDGLAPENIEQRIAVLIDLAVVSHFLFKAANIRRYADEALRLAERIGRDDLAARALAEMAIADTSDGEVVASVERFRQAFARAGPDQRRPLIVANDQYGQNLYYLGQYEEAAHRIQEVLDFARNSHDTTYTPRALGVLLLTQAAQGHYRDALERLDEARRFAREHGTGRWLARAIAMWGGVHLDAGDYAGAEALAEEARELARSVGFPQAIAATGIDLLFNYARRHEVGRAETLIAPVAEAVAHAQGLHSWLWRLRLAQVRAEIALARGDHEEALSRAQVALTQSRKAGRLKYEVAGLLTCGQTLVALGQESQGITDLRRAVELARLLGDPAIFLRAATVLLSLDGDDVLLAEALATTETIAAALPDDEMLHAFQAAEPARLVARLTGARAPER